MNLEESFTEEVRVTQSLRLDIPGLEEGPEATPGDEVGTKTKSGSNPSKKESDSDSTFRKNPVTKRFLRPDPLDKTDSLIP